MGSCGHPKGRFNNNNIETITWFIFAQKDLS